MPAPRLIPLPLHADTLRVVARDLVAVLDGAGGDLSDALVLLPGTRVCRELQHVLLDETGAEALLLPRTVTVEAWAAEAALACGLDPGRVPDERIRPLALAARLAALPWLADRPESAPGLARELIAFFDEARLAGRADDLLEGPPDGEGLPGVGAAEAPVVARDLERIREAWPLYRDLVPADGVDLLVATAAALEAAPPAAVRPPRLVVAAGFGRVDAVRARLLRAALATGAEGRLYVPAAGDDLTRFFLATWGPEAGATDPLAPGRRVARLVGGAEPPPPPTDAPPLRARLAALAGRTPPAGFLAPDGPLEIRPCPDAETESRVVADRVVRALRDHGPDHRVIVATNDVRLAARIRAQLGAAGLDVDHTHGDPLSALPAGLLVRFALRTVLTDFRAETLLEVLAHPFVKLPVAAEKHATWVRRLERMFRRAHGGRGGLDALRRRAAEWDAAAESLRDGDGAGTGTGTAGMTDYVERIAAAFAPLREAARGGRRPWAGMLAALRATWDALAPDHALDAEGAAADVARLADLLDALARDADLLPPVDAAGFAADLGRLLAAENAPAHRRRNLPVVVTGLVEARLARCGTLVLAGLQDGVFPTRSRRPLFLGGALRARLGLPGWTDGLARDAELFARLLHAAPSVLLTWAEESDGAPALPSGFVARLELALGTAPMPADEPPLWRRADAGQDAAAEAARAAERIFAASLADLRATVPVRPLTRLSWSALRTWRECPYRFLLERGFALRRDEEVQEEFRALEYGTVVHAVLEEWLAPDGPAGALLAAGDEAGAVGLLTGIARRHFGEGGEDLPQRRLAGETFLALAPALARVETARFATWRPFALERDFVLPLPALRGWVEAQAAAAGVDADLPAPTDPAAGIILRGTVDRLDRRLDDGDAWAVLDYKTGAVPAARRVAELDDLQIVLYAAAAECGALENVDARGTVVAGAYYKVGAREIGPPARPHLPDGDEGRALLVRGGARLVDLAQQAAAADAPFPVLARELAGEGPARLPCATCDFRGVCRVEELDVPPGTARKLDKLVNRKDGF